MVTTDKLNCNLLTDILIGHGVRHIIASPGSRNAPLLRSLSDREEIDMRMVIDERSAAFIALGLAIESNEPVAIACTSGTALLNYAPAVAEAYYRGVPLIVVSADRPVEWIDQDDSQTIRQPGALTTITKATYDIPARLPLSDDRWMVEREINDAMSVALSPRRGPVHINIRIDAPLGNSAEYKPGSARIIQSSALRPAVDRQLVARLADEISGCRKVMIIAGFMAPDPRLEKSLAKIASMPNVAMLTETVANIHDKSFIPAIDLTQSAASPDESEALRPDLVITLGGALVSRKIKEYLRATKDLQHWHVGSASHLIDCFRKLTLALDCEPVDLFSQLAGKLAENDSVESEYRSEWLRLYSKGLESHKRYVDESAWSDMKAFDTIFAMLPPQQRLHFSNGTPIRYSQLFGHLQRGRVDCNRGVSGIDGSTSTALGASLAGAGSVVLITGDMSMQYDIAALSSRQITPRLKIIVVMNSGGGIFRFVESTSRMPRREMFFSECMNLPVRQIAEAYGFGYYEASDEASLRSAMPDFLSEDSRPVILAVSTPAEESAEILRAYFSRR